MGRTFKKHCKVRVCRHGRNFRRRCHEGTATVNQSFRTGSVTGLLNVLVPIFVNIGDATVFNRSNQNAFNNII